MFKNWSVSLDQRYTGKVYTTATNSSSLDSFLLTDLSINRYLMKKKFYLSFKLSNLFNTAYEMTPSRPMPNRNYQFNINYKF
jgi:iron complex outermembrane receptor protein